MSEITSSGKQNKNSPNGTGVQKIRTMIEGFDDISHGGLPLGRTTLFSGTSGTGKTLFSVQFLYNGILFLTSQVYSLLLKNLPVILLKRLQFWLELTKTD